MKRLISDATQRNWKKLNVGNPAGKLTSGANKRLSKRQFIPLDYLADKHNLPYVKELLAAADEQGWETKELLYSLAVRLLDQKGILYRAHVQQVLAEYRTREIPAVCEGAVPDTEPDLLGLIYQARQTEGRKNKNGSYYTNQAIVSRMLEDLDFSAGQKLLDPCCGSGAFLLAVEGAGPEQLAGMDVDPVAVMIARCNLLLKFHDREFIPRIVCGDYLKETEKPSVDYIVTNPPWGAVTNCPKLTELQSEESFSYFLVHAYYQLKEGGVLRFLLPESILSVRVHRDIRQFILEHGNLAAITGFSAFFSGVMTAYVALEVRREEPGQLVRFVDAAGERMLDRRHFYRSDNLVFYLLEERDHQLIEKLQDHCCYTLADSIWALGIVTGNNRQVLKKEQEPGSEPIYTGKEIAAYQLKPPVKFIKYDRTALQQVAREECYRAPEKLVYRFISNNLIVAYDSTGSLFLNSANILIPMIPGMSLKTVLAFLNSEIYHYLYAALFGDVKVLRSNLEELKFPQITPLLDRRLTALVDRALEGDKRAHTRIQELLYECFGANENERKRIQELGQMRRNRQCLE